MKKKLLTDKAKEIIAELSSNYDEIPLIHPTKNSWSIADLFIRQWLNNMSDGFDMVRVKEMYRMLCDNKHVLIDNNLVSRDAQNNSGFPLWKDYDFDKFNE
jgi:hypothetical protein